MMIDRLIWSVGIEAECFGLAIAVALLSADGSSAGGCGRVGIADAAETWGPRAWIVTCCPDRCKSVHGSNACVRREAMYGHPGLARSRESTAQCCGQNFLRFCGPASRRKPVVCHPWQTSLVACDEPMFFTLRKTNKRSTASAERTAVLGSTSGHAPSARKRDLMDPQQLGHESAWF